jgi:hypothetical protein
VHRGAAQHLWLLGAPPEVCIGDRAQERSEREQLCCGTALRRGTELGGGREFTCTESNRELRSASFSTGTHIKSQWDSFMGLTFQVPLRRLP